MVERVLVTEAASGRATEQISTCLNCGTTLTGRYCRECGQRSRLRPLSLGALFKELVEEIFDLDSKAWRSLRPLMLQPGRITNEYLAGRRASYVSPLRLYLTASVLFFIVAAPTGNTPPVPWGDADEARRAIETANQEDGANASIVLSGSCDEIRIDLDADWARTWQERLIGSCKRVTADSGKSLERASFDNVPIIMVIFIPVLALVMKLLYPLSKRFYVEHLVFFLHYHAFGFFMLILMILIYESGDTIGWSKTAWRIVSIAGSGSMALYLLVAMRRVYLQGWLATSAKYLLLFMTYLTGLSISLFGVMLYTALTL